MAAATHLVVELVVILTWLLQSWHQSAELGEFSVLGLIAVGTGLLFQQQASQNAQLQTP